ncbi:hypothetical protein POJ06DRAFT_298168 [Lipomyces tetrasporus]|uniref:Uncharacterized protein n=1 Tax=Lipomyces tetrasporus TaxID=54092 RepID=A0AAD7VW37_9ASCO|nr:uncharacterized protein POJ06DRAFT_298168 [Lipomyces tetrasporus]KAJ8103721.1 hypothetical protein POJ06DRAFT_298168 [Lipomyces tetrasporus]
MNERHHDEVTQLNIQQGFYGPLRCRGHTWAGKLNEAFIEVWRRDSCDRFYLIQRGFCLNDLPVTLGLRISEFYPHDAWEAANIEDRTVHFDGARFLEGLRRDIELAAQCRFERFLFGKLGL